MITFKTMAKKAKAISGAGGASSEYLLKEYYSGGMASTDKIPVGFLAVYVGEEKERFLVPTSFLSHPLFKMLLEKAYEEYGFEQKNGLVVPCSVSAFQQVVDVVACNHGRFDMRKLIEEIIT